MMRCRLGVSSEQLGHADLVEEIISDDFQQALAGVAVAIVLASESLRGVVVFDLGVVQDLVTWRP